MNKKADRLYSESRRVKPWMYTVALLVNLLVFGFIGWVYVSSHNSYSERLFDENINNVQNLNTASANAALTYTDGMGTKIDDLVGYIQAEELTRDETVKFLEQANTDTDRQLQLVLCGTYGESGTLSYGDYSGVSIRRVLLPDGSLSVQTSEIIYGSSYFGMFRAFADVEDESFDGVCFAPEFTDPDTKLKCFAVYRHTVLKDDDGGSSLYAVLLAVNSEKALSAYDVNSKYDGQSNVLVNADGDYIIKNSDYRNVNFYDYIANYNGLALDVREKLKDDILTGTADGSQVDLFYKNHQGWDCVFSVAAMGNGWYSITCVPLSSFNLTDDAVDYSLIILLIFLVLFLMDGLAIYLIGKMMSYNITVAENATREANDANKAKSRFLSTMSHELRTPLNAIIGLVTLSGDSIDDPFVLRDYLHKIDISSKLLLQLISDILDVSAIESDKLKLNTYEFDLTRLISALSAIYYDQCTAKGLEFNVAVKNLRSETYVGDSVRVNQVLLNFLSNAVKYTPSGGKVKLSAEQIERNDDTAVIRFSVSDTGCGISDELKARLFKPFERASGETARKHGGTGLGLSIAKSLVELMNGKVGVYSTEGAGTEFWAEIPFGMPEDSVKRSFSPIEDMRVIAAISDDAEREYIGQMLAGFGIERTLADDAKSAMEHLREREGGKNSYDLCILDWKLRDLCGADAAKLIRSEFDKETLRIVLLAYNVAEAGAVCADSGADMVFGRPVFPSSLYNLLEEIVSDSIRAVPETGENYGLTGKRVLLVEDNKLNTEIARLLLGRVGIEVETADDGKQGSDAFIASENGHFDAVLMDVQMPVMDGYKATAVIRNSNHPQAKTIPILAMTADAFADDVEKAKAANMNEHISKPIVTENLYAVLKAYLCK